MNNYECYGNKYKYVGSIDDGLRLFPNQDTYKCDMCIEQCQCHIDSINNIRQQVNKFKEHLKTI